MKVEMMLELPDVPGSLIRALTPVSAHGGNIKSVVHDRGGRDKVRVRVSFLVSDDKSLALIKKELGKVKVNVREITVEGKRYYSSGRLSFILVGHIIDGDIRDTIDRLNESGLVTDVDVEMPDPGEKSTVLMNMKLEKKKRRTIENKLQKLCREKKFLLIKSIN